MKIKFKNGKKMRCTTPVEQKIFKTVGDKTIHIGWVLNIKIINTLTSDDIDDIFKPENISQLDFFSDNDEAEKLIFTLTGYDKITSSVIHYSENENESNVEIQLSKGL